MNALQANQQTKKPQVKKPVNEYESLEGNVVKATQKVASQEASKAAKVMWEQLLGVGQYKQEGKPANKMGGEMKPGQAIDLKAKPKETPLPQAEAPINYFREVAEAGKNNIYKEQQQLRQEVQSIIYELHRLASSSKQLQKDVSMAIGSSAAPRKMGKYHANFFEWMLIVVRDARKRVENAGAWLTTVKSKKKGVFSSMKKNMSQLMSGERSVSNQNG